MNCDSCSISIPANFTALLKSNICPSCGNKIMNDNTLDLWNGLKNAIEEMSEITPDNLTNWILSEYKIQKIGSGEPTKFYTKKDERKMPTIGRKKSSNDPETYFKERGVNLGVKPKKKKPNNQELLAKINGEIEEEQMIESDDMESNDEQEDFNPSDAKEWQYFQQLASKDSDLTDEDKQIMQVIAENAGGNRKLENYIEQDRMERLERQRQNSAESPFRRAD